MVAYTAPDQSALAGIPSQDSDSIGVTPEGLLSGYLPAVFNEDLVFAAGNSFPAYTPVGLNASGQVIPAVAGSVQAIGITFYAVDATAGAVEAPVYRAGCFNPAMLNWPASYNTDALKTAAFRGAPSPTQIIVRKRKTATVTLP